MAMWANFAGKNFDTAEQFAARVAGLDWSPNQWRPVAITIHNTSAPTVAQWVEGGAAHDARIVNLESFYEKEKRWHAGPHFFVSRSHVSGFSDPLMPGVHASCFNRTHLGIELVGDFDTEDPNAPGSDAAKVFSMGIGAAAALCLRLGLSPSTAINFHQDCKVDNHACPGKLFRRSLFCLLVANRMQGMAPLPVPTPPPPAKHPWDNFEGPIHPRGDYRTAWVQKSLGTLLGEPKPMVDGLMGSETELALRKFQHEANITEDGLIGPQSTDALQSALYAQGTH